MVATRRVRVLALHARWACRSAGACCTSGWTIALERDREPAVRGALASGRLRARGGGGPALLPLAGVPEAEAALAQDAAGRCVFFQPGDRRCSIHRVLGHEALPASCRLFPRVAVLAPHAVSLSLSHWCPTAAGLLFEDEGGLEVVENTPGFPPGGEYEGLDARAGFGPLLRPGVLLGWDVHERWEAATLATLARPGLLPETALSVLAARAEDLRAWRPGGAALAAHAEAVLAGHGPGPALAPSGAAARAAWRTVADCIPEPLRPPAPDEATDEADARWVAPAWPAWSPVVRRYLAARAFASWCAVQGEGLRTAVRFLAAALAVLRVEAARGAAEKGRALDAPLLKEAVRRADLLLVHLASPAALAARLSAREGAALEDAHVQA